jgi:hypothetical protein
MSPNPPFAPPYPPSLAPHPPNQGGPVLGHGLCGQLSALPFFGASCTCSATNGGTGALAQCAETLPLGLGTVGLRVELEPCAQPAYVETYLQNPTTSQWVRENHLTYGAAPDSIRVPFFTFYLFGFNLHLRLCVSRDAHLPLAPSPCARTASRRQGAHCCAALRWCMCRALSRTLAFL